MSRSPSVRKPKALVPKREPWPSTMVFPQNLRDAIPASSARALELHAFDLHVFNTNQTGPRVQAILSVKETGKLTGTFEVLLDLQAPAARELAKRLLDLAEQAENTPSVPLF